MASSSLNLLFFLIFPCLWTSHVARDTIKPGETLDSSSFLVSANGKFTLGFYSNEDSSNSSYLAIKRAGLSNYAWIANRSMNILHPFGVLTLDQRKTLKIIHKGGGNPIHIFSAPETTNNTVATLLDSGNFVLQEVNSDGSTKQVLWQSFDFPVDTLLPGMKLGVNHRNGQIWSLTSWLSERSAAPGPFTLDWDPKARELKIRRRGVVYWTSGAFRRGRFEYILPDHKSKLRYNFCIVSNEHEDYFTYTTVDPGYKPEWVLTTMGRLFDFDGRVDIAQADYCDGYNTHKGCQRWEQPICRHFGDRFYQQNGYFNPTTSYTATLKSDPNTSLSLTDCKVACWKSCDCLGFNDLFDNHTGCRFWTGPNWEFIQDHSGYSSSSVYILTTKSSRRHAKKWMWIGTAIATTLVLVMGICIMFRCLKKRIFAFSGESKTNIENGLRDLTGRSSNGNSLQNGGEMGHDLRVFSYASVMAATEKFSKENKLGEGGFGPVYKGKLMTGQEVAVKRLSRCSVQGTSEFKNELILISELQHTNLVQLLGFCVHGEERMLIYEHMQNKSLDYFLFDSIRGKILNWKKRFNIIEGVAQGLLYLHKYSRLRVIHRDLKASNILLDENLNPKISDFGLARIFAHNELEANTNRIVGTYGYMSPEYAMEGLYSIKSDVFSFGVLMLEIISGRKNSSFYNADRVLNIVGYAWELWKEGAGIELVDPRPDDSFITDQVVRCIHVGLLCVEEKAANRPIMQEVISMLTNESIPLPLPTKPAFSVGRESVEPDARKESEILSTNYLSNSNLVAR